MYFVDLYLLWGFMSKAKLNLFYQMRRCSVGDIMQVSSLRGIICGIIYKRRSENKWPILNQNSTIIYTQTNLHSKYYLILQLKH